MQSWVYGALAGASEVRTVTAVSTGCRPPSTPAMMPGPPVSRLSTSLPLPVVTAARTPA
ncbi:hypothetical protein [Streptomyces sp. NPDC057257]|uniref:hypothetical protein n=1 Tax=Streptomyces sp. NPDC057257 TaxID=3346071 RepID=UPI003634BB96